MLVQKEDKEDKNTKRLRMWVECSAWLARGVAGDEGTRWGGEGEALEGID